MMNMKAAVYSSLSRSRRSIDPVKYISSYIVAMQIMLYAGMHA